MGIERIWALGLLLALVPWLCQCISVTFQYIQQPLHVILNKTLVLEAQFQGPKEQIAHVTWERRTESGAGLRKVKVAEFPGSSINSRITTGNNGATLRVQGFRREDCGVYTLTVTSQSRTSVSADCIVKEYKAVHHVTVSINVSHTSLLCQEAWGTDPKFKWLHEKAQMNEEVGKPSVDGHVLYLSSEPCGHFTCVVSNRLGQSSATYTAEPCAKQSSSTAVVVMVFLVIQLSCGAALAFVVWRRRRRYLNRRERLTEPYEVHF